jgi:RNA-directed DNA polymerase
LNLCIKDNHQIFPVDARGINFLGYVFFHKYILLRDTIKKNFAKMLFKRRNVQSINSYKGWAKHCNSKNLLKKLLNE